MKSMEEQHSSSDILRREIQDQSQKESAELVEQAEREAKQILDRARSEAEKDRADILKKAETKADAVRKRILSGVHLDVKRQNLRTREEMISRLFQAVEERLNRFRKTKAYAASLKKLVIEGVLALDAKSIRILSGNVERKLLTEKMLSEVKKEVHHHTGREVKLVRSDQVLPEGGVVLVSSDERMLFDHRFSARMRRIQNEMRLEVVKRVMG